MKIVLFAIAFSLVAMPEDDKKVVKEEIVEEIVPPTPSISHKSKPVKDNDNEALKLLMVAYNFPVGPARTHPHK